MARDNDIVVPEPDGGAGPLRPARLRLKSALLELELETCLVAVGVSEVLVLTDQPAPVGVLVRFELHVESASAPIKGLGRVGWSRKSRGPDHRAGWGIEYVKLDERSRGAIEELAGSLPAPVPDQEGEGSAPGNETVEPAPDPPKRKAGAFEALAEPLGASISERTTLPVLAETALAEADRQKETPPRLEEAVLTTDAQGRILAWSAGARSLLGYSYDEAVGRPFASLATDAAREELEASLSLLFATSRSDREHPFLVAARSRDGRELMLEVSASPWSTHGLAFWSILLRPARTAHSLGEPGGAGEPPQLLEGKYRLLEEIGRGGMGRVFRAIDSSLDRVVAVKFLLPEHQAVPERVERFRREARAMAAVRQQNVLQIYAFGNHRGSDYFVMEHVRGETAQALLQRTVERGERMQVDEVVWIIDQACAGLAAVHRTGAVHRDIKPGNLMVQKSPRRVVIMDFGIVRQRIDRDAKKTPQPFGTPMYMAPEVIAGRPVQAAEDHLTDIYAVGVTLFELLTGEVPFGGRNWVEVFQRHLTAPPTPPSAHREGLPPALDATVLKCLAKEPSERFQSCEQLREALQPVAYATSAATGDAPAADGRTGTDRAALRARAARQQGARVLLASLDAPLREMARDCAREAIPGARFWTTTDALAALEMARSSPPLALIAAADDPTLNGIELAAALSGEGTTRDVKLVLMASSMRDEDRALLEAMGVTEVLAQPVSAAALTTALERLAASAASR